MKSKPRILLIGSGYIHTYNYAELIKPACQEILLVCDRKKDNAAIQTEVLDFSLRNISNHFTNPGKIRQIANSFKPDLVHIHQVSSFAYYGIRALQSQNIPVVLTAWGSDVLVLPKKNWILKRMVSYCLNKANAITADAHFMSKTIAQLCDKSEDEILISTFGIDVPEIEFEKEKIIYSNRLHKSLYRIDNIISAFYSFKQSDFGKDFKLVIAANGDKTSYYKEQVKSQGLDSSVDFVGWCDKETNQNWYKRSMFFVSIPESDGTAVSVLEAMAYGCIPLLSDIPANREWVETGKNGMLISNVQSAFLNDIADMNQKLISTLNRKLILERASKDVCFDKFINLYHSLLK